MRGETHFRFLEKRRSLPWLGAVSPVPSSAASASSSRNRDPFPARITPAARVCVCCLCLGSGTRWPLALTGSPWRVGLFIYLAARDPFPAVRTAVRRCCGGLLQGSWSPSPGPLVSVAQPLYHPLPLFCLKSFIAGRKEKSSASTLRTVVPHQGLGSQSVVEKSCCPFCSLGSRGGYGSAGRRAGCG